MKIPGYLSPSEVPHWKTLAQVLAGNELMVTSIEKCISSPTSTDPTTLPATGMIGPSSLNITSASAAKPSNTTAPLRKAIFETIPMLGTRWAAQSLLLFLLQLREDGEAAK